MTSSSFCRRHWSWLCGVGQGKCQEETSETVVVTTVVPEEADLAPDVGPDPVVLPRERKASCNTWERWTDGE